jgi:predicted nucleic acid-binding protein
MPFVLDASVAATWAFEDEDHPIAAAALQRMLDDWAAVPALWWFEVRNVLIINERRGRSTPALTAEFLTELRELSIEIEGLPEEVAVLDVARERKLTFYDASYLELAKRRELPLATLDAALLRAARAEHVELIE